MAASGGGSFAFPVTFDDEFTAAGHLASKWAEQVGPAPNGVADIDTTVAGALYLEHGLRCMVAPAAPFTVESRCTQVTWDAGPGVGGVWIVLGGGAPGPYVGFGPDVGNPGTMWLSGSTFSNAGNFIGNVPPGGVDPVAGYGYAVPHHTKLVVHSQSNIDAYVSFDDGGTWTTVTTGFNANFPIDFVGLEAGGSIAAWDWIRFTYP